MGVVSYNTGSAGSMDAVVNAIEAAASAAGWTTDIGDTPGGAGTDNEGRLLTMDWGADYYVKLQSYANIAGASIPDEFGAGNGPNIAGEGFRCYGWYELGSVVEEWPHGSEMDNSYLIGPIAYRNIDTTTEPLADGWVAPVFPVTYHIFVYDEPDMMAVIVQTGPVRYQWMMFGEVVKFGTWTGGLFYGASGVTGATDSSNQPAQPNFNRDGASTYNAYAPFFRSSKDFNRQLYPETNSNSRLYIETGTSETEIDDHPWGFCMDEDVGNLGGGQRLVREVVANVHWSPMSSRTPNAHNEVSVMIPYWLSTQRQNHRCLVGRVPWVRHIPIDNFNPGDTFDLGSDEWMVFPYLEREGITGLAGMALLRSSGS